MKKPKEIPVYMKGRQVYLMPAGDLLALRTYNTVSQGFPVKKIYYIKGKNEIHIEC
jgi:hypothetical protein